MDHTSISCSSSEVPSPVSNLPVIDNQSDSMIPITASNTNTTVNLSIVKPKIESSPPPPLKTANNYGDQIQRQTVLMWGAGSGHPEQQAMEPRTPPTQIKSPMCRPDQYNTPKQSQNPDSKKHNLGDDVRQQNTPKWNDNRDVKSLPVYAMQDMNIHQYPAINNQQTGNDAPMNDNPNLIADDEMTGSNCEVWPPTTYSQYQYITYHHGPNHQQHNCTQWVSNLLFFSNPKSPIQWKMVQISFLLIFRWFLCKNENWIFRSLKFQSDGSAS